MRIVRAKNLANRRKQRGIVMVEFIIMAPVVILIGLAVAELGNAILQYNMMTQSLRDGARHLAQNAEKGSSGSTVIDIDDALRTRVSNLVAYGVEGVGTPIVPDLAPANVAITELGGGQLSIEVTYAYQPILIGGIPRLYSDGRTNNLFTMRAEMIVRAL